MLNPSLSHTTTLFRRWVTSHGGVYNSPHESGPPNPYLAMIHDRDVVTGITVGETGKE